MMVNRESISRLLMEHQNRRPLMRARNILDRELKEKGIVPHHHSEDYRRAYEPAYRVVRRSAFEKNVDKKQD